EDWRRCCARSRMCSTASASTRSNSQNTSPIASHWLDASSASLTRLPSTWMESFAGTAGLGLAAEAAHHEAERVGVADEIAFDVVEIARRAPDVRQRRAAVFDAVLVEDREALDRVGVVARFVRGAADREVDRQRLARSRAHR